MQQDRTGFIGSSDAAAVLGLSRWSTPLQVWAEKTGQVVRPELDSEAVLLGTELEDYVARRFARLTGKKVQRVNEILTHPKHPFLCAQIDRRVVAEDALLECKTCSAWKAREWEGDEIPQEYIVQVMHQLAVTGKKTGYIAVLIGNQEFKWKKIVRDEKAIAEMVAREVSFWTDFVLPETMPVLISCKDSDTLYNLFPIAEPESVVELGDAANILAEEIEALSEDIKSLEGTIEQKKNLLKVMLGENEAGQTPTYKITWKNQKTTRLDGKGLKEKEPETWERYAKTTETRVLRIKKTEEHNGKGQ